MNIFLTGISGYLGHVLVENLALAPEIDAITGIDISSPKFSLPEKVKFIQADIRSPEIASLMAGYDVVVHTAFIVLWLAKMPKSVMEDININGVRNVAKAALANNVRKFIHTSSTAVYDPDLTTGKHDVTEDLPIGTGNSFFYYSNGKAAAERTLAEVLQNTGTCLTFLRPPYIIGRRNLETVKGFRNNAFLFGHHDPRTQFIHEDDVASTFLQACRTDMPGPFNVAPDDFIQLSEVFKIIGVESVRVIPFWFARLVTALRWRYAGLATHPSWVDAQNHDFTVSNAKLKATGWRPRYGSADALRTAL